MSQQPATRQIVVPGLAVVTIRENGFNGFFNKAAVYEEQAFREGAENWSTSERIRSCLVFGAIHMVNLFYPLASILPLALGGGIFMYFYLRAYKRTRFRREAVFEASLVHRVYNRIALLVLVIAIGTLVRSVLVTSLTFFATIMIARVGMMLVSNGRNAMSEGQPLQATNRR